MNFSINDRIALFNGAAGTIVKFLHNGELGYDAVVRWDDGGESEVDTEWLIKAE